ncbi:RNA polymerase sigma-70 factor (ECF subfamily) [Kitasatospora viridis]|uniref:RNA polymerase sigma-70 factor (ECF subfamily) n=1 Tax=Kitasatospora viridis TaxID=281105 RepID=A0A561TTS7_9ACTN|nr:RNA polymerase sigma-70 factor (ECF subfamily) [Kitasatospora viridis]
MTAVVTDGEPGIDPQLVRAAQRGDPLAVAELMELLTPYVGRICGPIARQDGPDAAQEALIVVLRGLRQLREPAALLGWARTIAVREAVRVAQRAGRTVAEPLAELRAAGDPQLAADIEDTLARLTPEHRAVLVLRDVVGLDENAASSMLSVPLGTVRSRLARARRSFRKVWES